MARYVLLTFDKDEDAEFFVTSLAEGTVFCQHKEPGQDAGQYGYVDPRHVSVRAVFQKPTKFCECADPGDKSVLSAKFQWRIHYPGCKRPKSGVMQHPRNLLDPVDQHPKYRDIYLGVREGPRPKMP
jgi:hypothetical protein